MARTTIPLQKETRDRLKELGSKGDTYDDLINQLIDHYEGTESETEIEFDPVD